MWSEPSTRNAPPATKYFASFRSCAAISAPLYGSSRTGGARPGTRLHIDATATANIPRYARNSSEVRCFRYIARSAEAGLDEVDREHHAGVEQEQHGENQPGPHHRPTRVARPGGRTGVAVAVERAGGTEPPAAAFGRH